MNEKIYQTLKYAETEDWLDYHVIRPICYYLSVGFARLGTHPNTVTIWSMIIGAASCIFFAHGCFYYEGTTGLVCNLIAFFMLMVADLLDCTDGQLARMTGKKSRLGRILDGAAGFVWFIPIYFALAWRFYQHHDLEFQFLGISDTPQNALIATIFVIALALFSGFYGLAAQQRMADYYIQAHLFFLKGEKGSELDNSRQQQAIYDKMGPETSSLERAFQKSYIDYTKKQEHKTPQFQRLLAMLRERYGTPEHIPTEVRERLRGYSLPLMTWNGLLTFNFRTAGLFLFCLLDVPTLNFVWEIVGMGILAMYINHRHENFCKKVADSL